MTLPPQIVIRFGFSRREQRNSITSGDVILYQNHREGR